MRLLLIAGTYPPGRCGVGDYIASLAKGLSRIPGFRVGILTHRARERVPQDGIDVLAETDGWRFWDLPRLARAIRGWKPDLVHIHWPSQGFSGRLGPALLPVLCKFMGLRVVQTWHEPWLPNDKLRLRLQRRATDGLIFVRPDFMSLIQPQLVRYMPDCPRRVIGSGGALPRSELSEAERARLREQFLRGRGTLVVFFGFVYPKKGVEQLFDILDPALDSLLIVGEVLDAEYWERLERMARERGWAEKFQCTGYVDHQRAADLLCAADAVVLPFTAGGGDWNTSIHGALAQGTLVVTTSLQPQGDDPVRNLYTAPIADVAEMRKALRTHAGRRVAAPPADRWMEIARLHAGFYSEVQQQSAT